jgi:hypothetical protein
MTSTDSTTDPRTAYTAGLRQLADILDAHPDVPLPYEGRVSPISFAFHGYEVEDHAGELASAARILIPGIREKKADDAYFRVAGSLHGLRIECWAMREQVCERIVTGTREVTREVPDPEALAAVPTKVVTETVEDVRWECRPLLAPETAEAVSA